MVEKPSNLGGHKSGFVAIVGKPNVGKSTLLNAMLGRKLAIVTPKPQTTRKRILGVKSLPDAQLLLVDTPGLHESPSLVNRRMVERARTEMRSADVVLWLVDATEGEAGVDPSVARDLQGLRVPVCVALNKIDLVKKPSLLPLMAKVGGLLPGAEVVPVSALRGENLDTLLRVLVGLLPEGPALYGDEEWTDQTERELAAEIVREKVILETRQEVPYSVAVTVEGFEEKPEKNLVVIRATVHVEKKSQKPILLGEKGARIKKIGQAAREELERELGRRVYLELFVKVSEGWTSDPRKLAELGL
ncbi:MAG: GTPase Era [Candidatus Binatia bacterium]|nr:MAG: GTPase Era [Candidatus Binatia bacterium]